MLSFFMRDELFYYCCDTRPCTLSLSPVAGEWYRYKIDWFLKYTPNSSPVICKTTCRPSPVAADTGTTRLVF